MTWSRTASFAPRQYLVLAARHLAAETDGSMAGHVLGYARWTVADRYLPAGLRGAALAQHHVAVPGPAQPAARERC